MENSMGLKEKFFSWKTLISFALAFFILYFMITKIDPNQFWEAVKNANFGLYGLAFIVYYLAFPIRALRFQIMLKNNGIKSGLSELNSILLVSWFANCIVPAKMGDLYRGYLVKQKYNLPFFKTVGVIFVERVYDLLVLYIVIGITGIISFRGKVPDSILYTFEIGFVFILLLIIVTLGLRFYGYRIERWLPAKAETFYRRFLSGTVDSLQENGKLSGLTAMVWLMEGLSFYLVTKAINLSLPPVTLLFVALISALMTALPVTPAGLGIVEAAKVGVLVLLGQAQEVAVSAAIMDRIINYWSLILVGLFVYLNNFRYLRIGGIPNESNDCDSHL